MGVGSTIKVAILGDAKSLVKASEESVASLGQVEKSTQSAGSKFADFAKKAAAGAGLAAAAIVVTAIKNGDALNEAQDQLTNAMRAQGESTKGLTKTISPLLSSMEGLGFTNKDVYESLTQLTRGGMDVSKAIGYQGVVADVARAKHIGLQESALLVTKAYQGQGRALKSLGIDSNIAVGSQKAIATAYSAVGLAQTGLALVEEKIHDGRLKGKSASDALTAAQEKLKLSQQKLTAAGHGGADILALIGRRMDGTAATAAGSLHGKILALHAKFTDFTAHLGQMLIPIILKVVTVMEGFGKEVEKVGGWLMKHKEVMIALGVGIVAVLVPAFVAWAVSATAAAVATFMAALPVLLVVAAIALLVLGIFWLRDNWSSVWDFITSLPGYGIITAIIGFIGDQIGTLITGVQALWNFWAPIWSAIWGAVQTAWGYILPIVQFGIDFIIGYVGTIVRVVQIVASVFGAVAGFIFGAFSSAASFVGGIVTWIVETVGSIVGRVASILGGIVSAIVGPFNAAFQGIKDAWNSTIGSLHVKIPSWVPVFGGDTFDGPRLHSGGIFNSGHGEGLAMLKDGEGVFTTAQMAALGAGMSGGGSRGGRNIFNFPAGVDPAAVVQAQRRYERRNGTAA